MASGKIAYSSIWQAVTTMHIHILGICGTFMGGLAVLAKEAGHKVTGCDANVYPPMSTQLEAQGIELIQGFAAEQVQLNPDLYVVGNVVSRGNPLIEEILNRSLPYDGCWPWPARMARPPPRPCWPGSWKTPAMPRAS
jgi:UDP-N-acetylmuramate-alanine ligase